MSIPRRQLNATILADGKVLVIGGTNGFGNEDQNFNDLKKPVFSAELWDPATRESGRSWRLRACRGNITRPRSCCPTRQFSARAGASMLRAGLLGLAGPTTTATPRSTPPLSVRS